MFKKKNPIIKNKTTALPSTNLGFFKYNKKKKLKQTSVQKCIKTYF